MVLILQLMAPAGSWPAVMVRMFRTLVAPGWLPGGPLQSTPRLDAGVGTKVPDDGLIISRAEGRGGCLGPGRGSASHL
jgi:hypothetical protein